MSSGNGDALQDFYTEVKEIEKRDSVLTPKQQIDRLLRSGSTYFNLNPFEVLQLDPDATPEETKKKYRTLSILVHPDKNQDDKERAQSAFEAVNKAWKALDDPETKAKCMDVVEEAKAKVDQSVAEKKKKLKKEGKVPVVDEDTPAKYKQAVKNMTMKLFAELERKRRSQEVRDQDERKRKREEEIEVEHKAVVEREWMKNFEESREGRVASWKSFQSGSKSKPGPIPSTSTGPVGESKKAKKLKAFRPPKHKAESR